MSVNFAVQIEPQFGFTYEDIKAVAQKAESSGFHSLWCSDHFFLHDKAEEINCLECWTTLSALARDTTTLRLGPLVTCNSYRYPSLLAKISSSVDHLSGGRLEFGLGAGWKEIEYDAYGIPFPSAGERVSKLDEALHVIKTMWTEEKASYKGEYYEIKDAFCAPKPTQQPHPPIWIGGGKPRVLDIAARHATGINFIPFPKPDEYADKIEELNEACARHGRDPETLKKSHFTQCMIAETEGDVEDLLKFVAERRGTEVEKVREGLAAGFVGTPEQCAEQIGKYVDLGVSQFMLMFAYQRELVGVDLVGKHLVKHFA
jgi:F420-dependent oxidoreductase-like protein